MEIFQKLVFHNCIQAIENVKVIPTYLSINNKGYFFICSRHDDNLFFFEVGHTYGVMPPLTGLWLCTQIKKMDNSDIKYQSPFYSEDEDSEHGYRSFFRRF